MSKRSYSSKVKGLLEREGRIRKNGHASISDSVAEMLYPDSPRTLISKVAHDLKRLDVVYKTVEWYRKNGYSVAKVYEDQGTAIKEIILNPSDDELTMAEVQYLGEGKRKLHKIVKQTREATKQLFWYPEHSQIEGLGQPKLIGWPNARG